MQKCKKAVSLRTVRLSVPSGGSPDGTGGSPALPLERWKRLREILRDVTQLRREDHRAEWLRIGQERWGYDAEREEWGKHERERQELARIKSAPLMEQMRFAMLADIFGGGEQGRKKAARAMELEEGLPEGTLSGMAKPVKNKRAPRKNRSKSTPIKPDPAQSTSIEPDQG